MSSHRPLSGSPVAAGLGLGLAAWCALASVRPAAAQGAEAFRPPAVPLVVFDPMLSIWSEADHLTDDHTRHWTRREQSLVSLIRVDGKTYRLMGATPESAPALPQTGLQITPTRSVYEFEGAGMRVTLAFMTPALPSDLDVLTRPVTYLTWTVRALDGAAHRVEIYDSTSAQLAVNQPGESVAWARETMGALTALRVGTAAQNVLGQAGDDARIDWGYAYAAAPSAEASAAAGANGALIGSFARSGALPPSDDTRMPRPADDEQPVLAFVFNLGQIAPGARASRHLMVGYDEIATIKFFGHPLKPYWSRHGMKPAELFALAEKDYAALVVRCEAFDAALVDDAVRLGGADYGKICALAYRQCLAGHGIAADGNSQPLMFTKENTSNGDIATVDVIFPADPQMLLVSPTLAKATLVPILAYAASDHWKFPHAPHDLGTYPIARGRDNGGEAMPVEESGNMLILLDAISQLDGNTGFADTWWPKLAQWARFLEQYGLDPANQLCTDDFMGHLAHNANLSVKAILALAAYGDMCRIKGDTANADRYAKLARDDAAHWMQAAAEGDHYRLAFDKPGTWSQKYNLVWDRLLRLNVFPPEVAAREVAFYETQLQPYGLPLDSRTKLTKTDWTLWSATLANQPADFAALVAPVVKYLDHATARSPFVDSYRTDNVNSNGMRARPVIGGVFIKMLADRAVWTRWAGMDKTPSGPWAILPLAPTIREVIPTAQHDPQPWRYTTKAPPADWTRPGFDDSQWKEGLAGFGNREAHHTLWETPDIWIRRKWTLPSGDFKHLAFYAFHDDDAQIYLDGVLASKESGWIDDYDVLPIRSEALSLLKPGATVTVCAHCHQVQGGQEIDVGLADVSEP